MKSSIFLYILLHFIVSPSLAQTPPSPVSVLESRLIFPLQGQHTHGSSIVCLPGGDMLVVWFQGSGERQADDVRIMGARLKKGMKTWSTPFLMADTHNIPDCNPVVFLNKDNRLFLVWIAVQANRWENAILRYRTSTDYNHAGAPTWNWQDNILLKPDTAFVQAVISGFKALPPSTAGWSAYAPRYENSIVEASRDAGKRSMGWMTRIRPLVLPSGKILLPLYSDGYNMSLVAISDDNGSTWHSSRPIVGKGNVQPSLIQKKDGTLMAYMRDNGDAPSRVQISESTDQGENWTPARKSDIPNTASVQVLALQDGKWAFVGNDIDDGRYRFSLYLSGDEGKTWPWKIRLEDVKKDEGSFSYPSMIQTQDGLLHITYSANPKKHQESIKYVVVDPQKIIR